MFVRDGLSLLLFVLPPQATTSRRCSGSQSKQRKRVDSRWVRKAGLTKPQVHKPQYRHCKAKRERGAITSAPVVGVGGRRTYKPPSVLNQRLGGTLVRMDVMGEALGYSGRGRNTQRNRCASARLLPAEPCGRCISYSVSSRGCIRKAVLDNDGQTESVRRGNVGKRTAVPKEHLVCLLLTTHRLRATEWLSPSTKNVAILSAGIS